MTVIKNISQYIQSIFYFLSNKKKGGGEAGKNVVTCHNDNTYL